MKPILFNTEMVRAILEDRKTVTRRVVKLPSYVKNQGDGRYTLFADGTCYENQHLEDIQEYLKKPCNPGDVLYVRETWGCYEDFWGDAVGFMYRADFPDGATKYISAGVECDFPKWRPSIHMPKDVARIFLKVKSVRLEQLQDIIPVQALCEGTKEQFPPLAIDKFRDIWNSTIKKAEIDTYGWDANPYVWAIEFERCDEPT